LLPFLQGVGDGVCFLPFCSMIGTGSCTKSFEFLRTVRLYLNLRRGDARGPSRSFPPLSVLFVFPAASVNEVLRFLLFQQVCLGGIAVVRWHASRDVPLAPGRFRFPQSRRFLIARDRGRPYIVSLLYIFFLFLRR